MTLGNREERLKELRSKLLDTITSGNERFNHVFAIMN